MNWYLKVLKNYGVFNGRSRRKEYWLFAIFNVIFMIVFTLLDNILGTTIKIEEFKINSILQPEGLYCGVLNFIYAFALIVPGLAVKVRRLQDVGKSGWYLFIVFIPIYGVIRLIVLFCTDGEVGENKYGPNPKELQKAGFTSSI